MIETPNMPQNQLVIVWKLGKIILAILNPNK